MKRIKLTNYDDVVNVGRRIFYTRKVFKMPYPFELYTLLSAYCLKKNIEYTMNDHMIVVNLIEQKNNNI